MDDFHTPTRSPIVLPSVELDAHLHEQAAAITKRRHSMHSKQSSSRSQIIENPNHTPEDVGNLDDDLMTPPDVRLKFWLEKSKDLAKSKNQDAIDGWIRCTALARIVHGDTHWLFAMTHIQLGLKYLKQGLNEQALIHASKGRDILLSLGSHMMSHDPPPEGVHNISVAHYIIGQVFITQGKLKEAERSLLKAERASERYSHLPGGDVDTQLDLDIVSAMGRLSLEQEKYSLARDCYQKAIDLAKAALGPKDSHLFTFLRGLAKAQLKGDGDKVAAVGTLEEALNVAESSFGPDSEEVGDSLVSLGRAHMTHGPAETVEDYLQKGYSVYIAHFGQHHKTSVSCKDELCRYLLTKSGTQKNVLAMLKDLIAEKKITYGEDSIEVGESFKILGTLQLTLGEVKQAVKSLEKARVVYASVLGPKHKETASIVGTLDIIAGSVGNSGRTRDKPVFKTVV